MLRSTIEENNKYEAILNCELADETYKGWLDLTRILSRTGVSEKVDGPIFNFFGQLLFKPFKIEELALSRLSKSKIKVYKSNERKKYKEI